MSADRQESGKKLTAVSAVSSGLMVHLSDDFAGWSRMKEKASPQIVLIMAFSGFHSEGLTSQHSISADSADKNESKPSCSDDKPNELTLPTPLPDGLTLVSALTTDVSILTADESAVLPNHPGRSPNLLAAHPDVTADDAIQPNGNPTRLVDGLTLTTNASRQVDGFLKFSFNLLIIKKFCGFFVEKKFELRSEVCDKIRETFNRRSLFFLLFFYYLPAVFRKCMKITPYAFFNNIGQHLY